MKKKATVEMFGAEAAFHRPERSGTPLAGVIGEEKKREDDDYEDGNRDHHNQII